MDVGVLAGLYGGISERIVSRAREYMRMTSAKKSSSSDLTTPPACLLVAAKSMDELLDPDRLSKLAGVSRRLLGQSVRRIAGAVDVKSVVKTTPAALCIRFGCEAISELVNRVYGEYQVVAEKMSRGRNKTRIFDYREPIFAAACLYAASKQANLRVDRVKLLDAVCGNPKAFEAIVSSIESHCKASLSGAILTRRKRSAPESAADSSEAFEASAYLTATPQKNASSSKAHKKILLQIQQGQSQGSTTSAVSPKISVGARGRNAIAPTSEEEYQAWRLKALTHMRQRQMREREQQGR